MTLDPRWSEALRLLPDYLGSHLRVSLAALVLGTAISLPLALVARHRPWLRGALLAAAGIVQTVPGLALLALFYPLLLAASALAFRIAGVSFSAFGFLPAMLALALYSLLPVLRNTITGLDGVAPELIEAAKGVGMTPRQQLTMVELPLALPVIMAGLRTAAVWVIGTATLSTPIGQTSLGNYIFAGLQTQNWVFVLVGCAAAAALALVVDLLLALLEQGLARRSRLRIAGGLVGALVLATVALAPAAGRASGTYVVGAKTFAESYVLAALIDQRLAAAGLAATTREGLGSSVIFSALKAGDIDVYVDYSGTLWTATLQRHDMPPREELTRALADALQPTGVTIAGALGFENAYVLAMPRSRAAALGIRSIGDLAGHAGLRYAADYEFFDRPEWAALRTAYGLDAPNRRQMQPDFMYAAAAAGEVDVIAGYSSDGQLAKHDLVVLSDPRGAIPPYDALVLLAPQRAHDGALHDALKPLIGRIDIDAMRAANLRAADGGADASARAVAQWLWHRVAHKDSN